MALGLPFTDNFVGTGNLSASVYSTYFYPSTGTPPSSATMNGAELAMTTSGTGGYSDEVHIVPNIVMANDPVVSWIGKASSLGGVNYWRVYLRADSNVAYNQFNGGMIYIDFMFANNTARLGWQYSGGTITGSITPDYVAGDLFSTSYLNYELLVHGPDVELRYWTTTRPVAAQKIWSGVPVKPGYIGLALQGGYAAPTMTVTLDKLTIADNNPNYTGSWAASGAGTMAQSSLIGISGGLDRAGDSAVVLVQSGMTTGGGLGITGGSFLNDVGTPRPTGSLALAGSSVSSRSATQRVTGTWNQTGGSSSTRNGVFGVTRTLSLAGGGTQLLSRAVGGAGMIPGLPGNVATGLITGTFIDHADGTPEEGSVTFTPSVPRFVDAIYDTVIDADPITVPLDRYGVLSARLVATTNAELAPPSFSYRVTENWTRGRTYTITVPAGSTVDLSDM